MPLIGKLGPGRLLSLLKDLQNNQQEGRIVLHREQHSATIALCAGEIHELTYEHQDLQGGLAQISQWAEGVFHVYHPGEPEFPSSARPLWLVMQDPLQLKKLREDLRSLPYPVWVFSEIDEMAELLTPSPPLLLLLEAHLAPTILSPLLPLLQKRDNAGRRVRVLLLGDVPQTFKAPPELSVHQLNWPSPSEMLHKTLQALLPTPPPQPIFPPETEPKQVISDSSEQLVSLLSAMTPPLPEEMGVQVHTEKRKLLEQLQISPPWQHWLLTLDANHPVSSYLPHCPGRAEQADVVLRYLLHLGVLTTQNALSSLLTSPEPGETLPGRKGDTPSHITKIIALGLRGQWKEDWIFSLQQIAQQWSRGSRDSSIHIPYLPKAEFARIPLPNDSLLLFYGLITEDKIEPLLKKTGGSVDAFLFFIDTSNDTELAYAQEMRQRLLQRYVVPYTVILAHPSVPPQEIPLHHLQLHPQERIVPINRLDERATSRVLHELLQQFPQHRHVIPTPPPEHP